MTRWARLDPVEDKTIVGEIITYDPQTIIHEDLLDRFVPCDESVMLGYYYNKETQEFYIPEGYGKKFLDEVTFSPVPPGFKEYAIPKASESARIYAVPPITSPVIPLGT